MKESLHSAFVACHHLEEAHIALLHAFHIPLRGLPSAMLLEMRRHIRVACEHLKILGADERTIRQCSQAQDAFLSQKAFLELSPEAGSNVFNATYLASRKLDIAMQQVRDRLLPPELIAFYSGWFFSRLGFYSQLVYRGPVIFSKNGALSENWRDLSVRQLERTVATIKANLPSNYGELVGKDAEGYLGLEVLFGSGSQLAPHDLSKVGAARIRDAVDSVLAGFGVEALGSWILDELEIRFGVTTIKKPTSQEFADLDALLDQVNGYTGSYEQTSDLPSLEKGIALLESRLADFSESPLSVTVLDRLAGHLLERSNATGSREDMNRSVHSVRQVLRRFPSMFPAGAVLNNMGLALSSRFEVIGDTEDLLGSVDAFAEATAGQPYPHGRSLMWWNNHANALRLLFHFVTRDSSDLDHAIKRMRVVVERTPAASRDKGIHKQNLANMLRERLMFVVESKSPDDLDEPIQLLEEALHAEWTPAIDRPIVLASLAAARAHRYSRSRNENDREASTNYYRMCVAEGAQTRPNIVLKAAMQWGNLAFVHKDWNEAVEAFRAAREVSKRVLQIQLGRDHRESVLEWSQGATADAAFALVQIGELQEAVVTLEAGAAQMLSQALETGRRDLESLCEKGHSKLYERYRDITETLALESAKLDQPRISVRGTQEETWTSLTTLHESLTATVEEVRLIPGFENFQRDVTWCEIAGTHLDTIVYLIATAHGGAALLVVRGEVQAVPLPQLDRSFEQRLLAVHFGSISEFLESAKTEEDQRRWQESFKHILVELGSVVLKLLATFLPPGRVALIPIGGLQLLPFHAAPPSTDLDESLLDGWKPYYIPNVRTLLRGDAVHAWTDELLMIKVGDSEQQAPLPHTNLERDLIHRCSERFVLLEEAEATRTAVLEHVGKTDITHFSCHGAARLDEPLESSLILHGGERVTVRDLFNLRRACGYLVSLSACETGVSGLALPDEVIGMPTALIATGTSSVISTLWVVGDLAAAFFFGKFYSLWLHEGVDSFDAFIQAQRWLKRVSVNELVEFLNDLGPWSENSFAGSISVALKRRSSDERLFAHPTTWAPFHWTGLVTA